MLRTFDIVLVVVMTAAATVTYTIKHRAESKLEEIHKLDAEIKLEEDTIELLKADWALVTQPSRLERLVGVYRQDLSIEPTPSTQIVQPQELPMLKADVPPPPEPKDAKDGKAAKVAQDKKKPATDAIATGSVAR
ncbi:hypothetical protein BJF93_21185 [Xaviernesmea oryzae]|uniref:Cell division protein FtsL n=1 Tax=Xaviernesmea oryzae TaxID=464029 RepID=A0A1Q9AZZ7_9HYPH|nr:hypothetical protein [Xaviernesmea oryzae]OLP61293.1 hypothetical protein BJF93_21185 [Xaviernesmea oryzae]SEL54021.1 hypothetical protein SAMN04487976_109115 [Xaviernesmea oryzae]